MTNLRLGGICSGYGGLHAALEQATGGTTVFVSDVLDGPNRVLAKRFPEAVNIGDCTSVAWTPDCPDCQVPLTVVRDDAGDFAGYVCDSGDAHAPGSPVVFGTDLRGDHPYPVHVFDAGTPCQDLSQAGRRAGMVEGTRSNLWVAMREGLARLRPNVVVWENVRGALSAKAHCEAENDYDEENPLRPMEPGTRRMGGNADHALLTAFGRVLGDLASLGYDAQWQIVSASSVGAPHRRDRIFLLAYRDEKFVTDYFQEHRPELTDFGGDHALVLPTPCAQPSGNSASAHLRKKPGRSRVTDLAVLVEGDLLATGGRLLPTPRTNDHTGPGIHGHGGQDLRTVISLLPTPDAYAGTRGGTQDPALRRAGGHSISLGDVVEHKLVPTPSVADAKGGHISRSGNRKNELLLGGLASGGHLGRFGPYAEAISRWEARMGRLCPPPTQPTARSEAACPVHGEAGGTGECACSQRLSAKFVEWLMGLPDGWVTDIDGLSRSQQLHLLGNGVVPAQALAALTLLRRRFAPSQTLAAAA